MKKTLSEKFDEIVTISYPAPAVEVRDVPGMGDEYVLVLLRHQGLLRDTYYLNLRPKKEDDDVYSNHFGLFGGKIDKLNKDGKGLRKETEEAAAEREILEETGLAIGQDAYWLADIVGFNNEKKKTKGTIYLKVFRKSPYGTITAHLKKENPRLKKLGRNEIGRVITIHRWRFGLLFFFRWWRLTPQSAYALRDVLKRDPTR